MGKDKTVVSAHSFVKVLHDACPLEIVKLLSDNGKEFTDRLFASRECQRGGNTRLSNSARNSRAWSVGHE